MLSVSKERFKKISRTSRWVRIICQVMSGFTVLLGAGFALLLVLSPHADASSGVLGRYVQQGFNFSFKLGEISEGTLSVLDKLIVGVVLLMFIALILKGLHHLKVLLRCYERGDIFSDQSIFQARKVAFTYVLWLVFCSMPYFVGIFVDPWRITIKVPFDELIVWGVIYLVVWTMEVGRELYVDNELTV